MLVCFTIALYSSYIYYVVSTTSIKHNTPVILPVAVLMVTSHLLVLSSCCVDGHVALQDAPGPGHDGSPQRRHHRGPDSQPGTVPGPDPVPPRDCHRGHEHHCRAWHGPAACTGCCHTGERWRDKREVGSQGVEARWVTWVASSLYYSKFTGTCWRLSYSVLD